MIEKLIKAGADPNAALTKFGDTALMMTATGKTDAVKVLLDHSAQVNAQGDLGRYHRLDVGRFRAPSGRREDADRPRRGRQCQIGVCTVGIRPRL